MKRIIVNVTCVNTEVDDTASIYTVHISTEMAERIKELSTNVKKLSLYKLVTLDYTGTWSTSNYSDNDEIEDDIKERDLITVIKAIESDNFRTDCDTLNITDSEFWFSSVPRHCDDSVKINTKRLPISILDESNPVYIRIDH